MPPWLTSTAAERRANRAAPRTSNVAPATFAVPESSSTELIVCVNRAAASCSGEPAARGLPAATGPPEARCAAAAYSARTSASLAKSKSAPPSRPPPPLRLLA